MSTVCAGCGMKDGEHADTCRDLDGIRIRLEKRVADLEMELAFEKGRLAQLDSARMMDNFWADQLVVAVLDFCKVVTHLPIIQIHLRWQMIESAKAIQQARIERP